jgi:GTPase SAR1 family protein
MEKRAFQISLIGSEIYGKSAFESRYLWDHWMGDTYNPIIEEVWTRTEIIDNEPHSVLLLPDVKSIGEYENHMAPTIEGIIKSLDGIIVAYNITRNSSFREIEQCRADVLRIKQSEQWPMILIETHCDLENQRVVPREEGEAVARRWGVPFISTSARTSLNIHESVIALIKEIKRFKQNEWMKQQGTYKKPIPNLEIPSLMTSTMIDDIMTHLFNNKLYSDLTLVAENTPIYVHSKL